MEPKLMTKRPAVLAQVVQPKKLEVQQWQYLHRAPLSHVEKPKELERQQWLHVHRGPPGPAE